MATSYANEGGSGGARARYIALTTAGGFSGNPYVLLNGNTSDTGYFFTGGATSGYTLTFDFGDDAYIIDEAIWYQSSATSHGTWKWQGSNDGSSWTDIGASFTLGSSTTQTLTTLNGNTTAYKQYRLQGISGVPTPVHGCTKLNSRSHLSRIGRTGPVTRTRSAAEIGHLPLP
jgi:hypothetical protein